MQFQRKNGSTFPGELTARRLSDGTIQCILRDVTDRRRAERAARTAEGRLRDIFENSPIGVFFVRVAPRGRFIAETINPYGERAQGGVSGKSAGFAVGDILLPAERAVVEGHYRRCAAGGVPVDCECGTVRGGQAGVLLVPLRSPDGRIRRIAGFVHDITEQKRAELALRESEARFSKVFHSSPGAIAVTEFDTGRVLEINASFLRLFGLSSEQTRGRSMIDFGVWADAADRARFLDALQTRGAVRGFEIRWCSPLGERICLLTAEKIELHGRPCILSLVDDVTELRRAERERAEAAERGRRADADFTKRLIESQEAERRRIAGELHDSLGQEMLLIANRMQLALGHAILAPALREELEGIGALATQAVAEVRRISHALRPPQLDHLGLTRACAPARQCCADRRFPALLPGRGHRRGLPGGDGGELVPHPAGGVDTTFLKHAQARNVDVVLEHDVRAIRLIVADDGRGFVPTAAAGGIGLRNIAERVRILGGELRIDSAPETGTRLEITAPLPAEI
jgi:PAS domain S-box-containing protein